MKTEIKITTVRNQKLKHPKNLLHITMRRKKEGRISQEAGYMIINYYNITILLQLLQ